MCFGLVWLGLFGFVLFGFVLFCFFPTDLPLVTGFGVLIPFSAMPYILERSPTPVLKCSVIEKPVNYTVGKNEMKILGLSSSQWHRFCQSLVTELHAVKPCSLCRGLGGSHRSSVRSACSFRESFSGRWVPSPVSTLIALQSHLQLINMTLWN